MIYTTSNSNKNIKTRDDIEPLEHHIDFNISLRRHYNTRIQDNPDPILEEILLVISQDPVRLKLRRGFSDCSSPMVEEIVKRSLIRWFAILSWPQISTEQLLEISLEQQERYMLNLAKDITNRSIEAIKNHELSYPGNNVFNLTVEFTRKADFVSIPRGGLDDDHVVERVLEESIEENTASCLVPATDTSIKSLKRKRTSSSTQEMISCSICLEELSADAEVLIMPCSKSHEFHADCITTWLKTSHYCPLCRYKMPTS